MNNVPLVCFRSLEFASKELLNILGLIVWNHYCSCFALAEVTTGLPSVAQVHGRIWSQYSPTPHLLIIVKNTPHIVAIILPNFTASINRKLLPLTVVGLCQHQIMLTLLECVCRCTMPALEAVDIRGCKLIRRGPRALWVLLSGKIFFFLNSSLILSQGRSCLGRHIWQTRKPV